MPNKQEVMDSIKLNKNYSGTETKNLIYSVKTAAEGYSIQPPKYIKLGDVFGGVMENRAVIRQFKKDLKQFYKGLL